MATADATIPLCGSISTARASTDDRVSGSLPSVKARLLSLYVEPETVAMNSRRQLFYCLICVTHVAVGPHALLPKAPKTSSASFRSAL